MLRREHIGLAGFCAVMAVGSVAAMLWILVKGEIAEQGLDAIFLLLTCAIFAAGFAWIAVDAFRKGFLKELVGGSKTAATPQKPAATSAVEGAKSAREA